MMDAYDKDKDNNTIKKDNNHWSLKATLNKSITIHILSTKLSYYCIKRQAND